VFCNIFIQGWELPWQLPFKNPFAPSYEEIMHKEFSLDKHGCLELENNVGPIIIRSWRQSHIALHAIKRGSEESVKATAITTKISENVLSITSHVLDDVNAICTVSYELMVPSSLNLTKVTTKKGAIKIKHIEGTIAVSTQEQGTIDITGSTNNVLAKAHGALRIKQTAMPAGTAIIVQSNTNSIELSLPHNINASLHAISGRGRIETEQSLTFEALIMPLNEKNIRKYLMHDVIATIGSFEESTIALTARKGAIYITEH